MSLSGEGKVTRSGSEISELPAPSYTPEMANVPKPSKFKVKPGENVWEALAREVATNPDSPTSLRLQSQVNRVMGPRTRAGDQLIEALADLVDHPEEAGAPAAVQAAISHWEKICGAKLDPELLKQFRQDAEALAARRRRQPPSLEFVVQGTQGRSDVGYELGLDLEGLRGTWHRLWAIIAMAFSFGDDPALVEGVAAVRGQFEQQLGRPLAPAEWEQLTAHARRHAETNMTPPGGAAGS